MVLYFDGVEQRVAAEMVARRAIRAALGGMPPGLAVTIETPEGEPGAMLAAMGAGGDLLVLGDRPGHELERVLHGSVSHYCCQHARCPVVVVPARPRSRIATG